jgi:alpha-ketoglutarate-dependent taurine dioxygenase
MPLFCLHDGKFTTQYSRTFVEAAQKLPDVPRMTAAQDEALDLHAQVCEELCFTMDMQPGDWQLLNNHVIYHGRTHYEDGDGLDQDRLLLRLWLSTPNSRALPAGYLPIWGTTAPSVPRGGIAQPA